MSESKREGTVLLKTTLLLSSVNGMVASALMVPLLADIAKSYPDAGPWLNQLLSLPSLLMIPAILITGKLADYISKKTLLLVGTLLFIIGGFGGIFATGVMDLVWTRALLGIGCGIVYPLAPAMIAYLYDGQERAQLMGWTNSCGGAVSFVLGIAAGYAALVDWKYAFYYYLLFVIVLIMQWFLLPDFLPEKKDPAITQAKLQTGATEKLGYRVWLTSLDMLIFMTVSMFIIFKLALFIVNEHIGTSADAGMASSINTLASFAVSMVFAQIWNKLKRFTVVVGLVCMSVCYFLFSIAHSYGMMMAAVIFLGFSMGLMFPYLMNRVSIVAPNSQKTFAISLLSMAIYLGQFFTGFYTQFVDWLTNGSIRSGFMFVAGNMAAFALIALVYVIFTRNREGESQTTIAG
ncbi:MFS transporter [Sporomusa aerivorans]|uniref:MFS transporter n=1 Tax=Sporomusa aerivorans TaxID=204936 RepID=UPI00352BC81A